MKTKTIAAIAAATALVSGIGQAANRTLILLQENSNGKSYLEGIVEDTTAIDRIIDAAIETTESAKFRGLARGKYQRFVDLSDVNCTRENLLRELIKQSKDGFVTDLAILGHGNQNILSLNGSGRLLGSPDFPQTDRFGRRDSRHIRNLLADARTRENNPNFEFKLRLVHMCNCFGSTLNDDWQAIGAKVSVGAQFNNFMPEPMNTFFWEDFLKKDKTVDKAAAASHTFTIPFYLALPDYHTVSPNTGRNKFDESRQIVTGDRHLIFRDEFRMGLNESRTFTINSRNEHTFVRVFTEPGQRYSFTANGDKWNDGGLFSPDVTAAGHSNSPVGPRRFPQFNAMSLCAERFDAPSTGPLIFGNTPFRIGTSHTRTFSGTGFLDVVANDNLYGDNRGSVKVTIKRIQ